jgi:predicted ArsR family transcriptional regulator
VDAQIIHTLEIFGRLTTPELATKLGLGRETVFKRCQQLERQGRLRSELTKAAGKSLFFFPMTKEVMTASSHAHITHLNDAILTVVRAYELPQERAMLVTALEIELERIAGIIGEHKRALFEEFTQMLLEVAATAEKRGDITQHLGIRPMRPVTRVWMLGQQLSLLPT